MAGYGDEKVGIKSQGGELTLEHMEQAMANIYKQLNFSRLAANLHILDYLADLARRDPDVRFIQLLMNSGVLTFNDNGIIDEHHVESVEILERMEK